jgi:cysteine desulfurase
MNQRIYFDNAATTPLHPLVIEEMTQLMQNHHGNPSSIYEEGRIVKAAIEDARKRIARHLNASVGEIFFTSGGTESTNMALKCSVRDLGVQRIITSPIEHHCVSHSLKELEKQGILIDYVEVDNQGHVKMETLEKLLAVKEKKTLVSIMHANNEVGTMIDLDAVSALCDDSGALFHSDTVQTVGHFPIDVSKTKISFLTGGAHKFHGPKGVGFVYINGDNVIAPFLDGGSQERNMRGGTENVYGIVGMAKALDLAYENLEEDIVYIKSLRRDFLNKLQENFEGIKLNGDVNGRSLYTVLSVSFPKTDKSDMLLMAMDIHGISASGGSACSSGAEQQSHVLSALGVDPSRKTIRFSFSKMNTMEEVETVIEKLKTIIPTKVEA